MKKFIQFVVLPLLCLSGVVIGIKVSKHNTDVVTDKNIEYIKQHVNMAGELIDYKDEISVKSAQDIRYYVKKDTIEIVFGKLRLVWKKDKFLEKENLDKLEGIGIEVKRDVKTRRLKLYWNKKVIEKWVS